MVDQLQNALVNSEDEGHSEASLIRETRPSELEGVINELLAIALQRRLDTPAAALVAAHALCAAAPPLTAASFDELVSAGMVEAALALARTEVGANSLADALADHGALDAGGEPPLRGYLHAAAAAGASQHMVKALLAAGCRVGQRARDGSTPLHEAAAGGHLATCRALIAAGAEVLARNGKGRTAKQLAGLLPEVREFLEEEEEAAKRCKRERDEAVWGSAVAATQTASALRTGCV